MALELDEQLIERFIKILEFPAPDGRKKELVIHDFMEKNSELIPTPNLLNHHLHLGVVISKFPLDTSLVTDYVYLTKSSDTWKVTFVELEIPDKKLFAMNKKQVDTYSDFNKAIAQVRSWKVFIEENKSEVVRRLEPLLVPIAMRRNPIEFDFQLIIGRSDEKNGSHERIKTLKHLRKETGIDIMTYDTLINYYRNCQIYKKDIISLSGNKMKFKKINQDSTMLFSHVTKDDFILTSEDKNFYKSKGYDIDEWEQGRVLAVNGKDTIDKSTELLRQKLSKN